MIDAWRYTFFYGCEDSHCQVARIGWRAYLVEDDAQLLTLPAQTNHRLHEVVAKGGIQPRCADNHGLFTMRLHVQLAHQFRLAIDAVGTGILVLRIGRVVGTVEDVVGADLNQKKIMII